MNKGVKRRRPGWDAETGDEWFWVSSIEDLSVTDESE